MIAFAHDNIIPMPTKRLALHFSNTNEWFTPHRYIEAARKVLGTIDLDPASCTQANWTVKAKMFYKQSENGLEQDWYGNVWLNPPYGRKDSQTGNVQLWIDKLISEYEIGNIKQAILLVNALPDRRWFDALWNYPICFVKTRISFYNPAFTKRQDTRPPHGNAIVYLGLNEQRFIDIFSEFGTVARRVSTPKERPVMLSLWGDA